MYILPDAYENSDCFILCYHMIVNFTHSSRVVRICISLLTIFSYLLDIWNVSVKGACLFCLLGLLEFVGETILLFKLALSSWAQSSILSPPLE